MVNHEETPPNSLMKIDIKSMSFHATNDGSNAFSWPIVCCVMKCIITPFFSMSIYRSPHLCNWVLTNSMEYIAQTKEFNSLQVHGLEGDSFSLWQWTTLNQFCFGWVYTHKITRFGHLIHSLKPCCKLWRISAVVP